MGVEKALVMIEDPVTCEKVWAIRFVDANIPAPFSDGPTKAEFDALVAEVASLTSEINTLKAAAPPAPANP